jgi:hypothetical protein
MCALVCCCCTFAIRRNFDRSCWSSFRLHYACCSGYQTETSWLATVLCDRDFLHCNSSILAGVKSGSGVAAMNESDEIKKDPHETEAFLSTAPNRAPGWRNDRDLYTIGRDQPPFALTDFQCAERSLLLSRETAERSGHLLIITDTHWHGDVSYELRGRAVFCDLAGPNFTQHRQKTPAPIELAILPRRLSSGNEIKITISISQFFSIYGNACPAIEVVLFAARPIAVPSKHHSYGINK